MQPIALSPEKAETIVLAFCSLHNFLCVQLGSSSVYTPSSSMDTENRETHEITPGEWRQEVQPQGWRPLSQQGSNHHATNAKELRDYMCEYFSSDVGSIPWQEKMI